MGGMITILEDGKKKKIKVGNVPRSKQRQKERNLMILFWIISLLGGLYVLAKFSHNFEDLKELLPGIGF